MERCQGHIWNAIHGRKNVNYVYSLTCISHKNWFIIIRFQSLLNPRQVFDLTQGGPGPAIEMFKNVPGKLLST